MATPYPDVDALLESLVPGLRRALGERLLGLYLFGSVVTGDYDAAVSDIDVLAVLDSSLSEPEIEPLALLLALETIPDTFRTLGNVVLDVAVTGVVSERNVLPDGTDISA